MNRATVASGHYWSAAVGALKKNLDFPTQEETRAMPHPHPQFKQTLAVPEHAATGKCVSRICLSPASRETRSMSGGRPEPAETGIVICSSVRGKVSAGVSRGATRCASRQGRVSILREVLVLVQPGRKQLAGAPGGLPDLPTFQSAGLTSDVLGACAGCATGIGRSCRPRNRCSLIGDLTRLSISGH